MWEYKFQTMGSAIEDEVIVILNELAYNGWELVAYDFAKGKGLFKRVRGGVRV
ncbi:hypothetical protein [Rhizobium sp. MHM7A]|uniref:hypothetical protein n=1 Tax=Rhizobium sp. MHM7A TaxID=2583233 RepID=UPI0014867835|nr:hypothetical protein [Rhizobium sp. MHM7A]